MLQRLHCLLLLAAVAFLASPATSAAVAVDAAAEQALPETPNLNLARRFTSPFAQLRERRTSRVGLAGAQKKRTLSDELLDMLRGESLCWLQVRLHRLAVEPSFLLGLAFSSLAPSALRAATAPFRNATFPFDP